MKFQVRKAEKYGKVVWQHVEMDDLRRKQCMCLNCVDMDVCPAAAELFEFCKEHNLALLVTRCPSFSPAVGLLPALEEIFERFESPFLPEGFVKLTPTGTYEVPGLNIQIGDRDLTILETGEITGQGTNCGDACEWRIERLPQKGSDDEH